MGNLDSVFGMCEMECAAEIIIEKCRENQSWSNVFRYSDFPVQKENWSNPSSYEQTGFLCLLAFGWMDNMPLSHSGFMVNKAFVDRILAKSKYQETANWELPDLVEFSLKHFNGPISEQGIKETE